MHSEYSQFPTQTGNLEICLKLGQIEELQGKCAGGIVKKRAHFTGYSRQGVRKQTNKQGNGKVKKRSRSQCPEFAGGNSSDCNETNALSALLCASY